MKTTAFFSMIGVGVLFVSCQSGQNEQKQAIDSLSQSNELRTPDQQERQYCFLRTEGSHQQDSSLLHLVVTGESVKGTYSTIPYEKDARRGTLLGKTDGEILDLVWTFTQEGMQDTLRVVFKQQGDKLLGKPFSVDQSSGRQITLDSSAFSETYQPVDCPLVP